jgi:hypothetical protein
MRFRAHNCQNCINRHLGQRASGSPLTLAVSVQLRRGNRWLDLSLQTMSLYTQPRMKKPLSRQMKWQLAKKAAGLCSTCGKRPLITASHCEICARPTKKDRGTGKHTVQSAKSDIVILLQREISNRQLDIDKLRYALVLLDSAGISPSRNRTRTKSESR